MSSPMQSSAAAIIGRIDDLLIDIFLFLPARSLVRFKLVSKHWCSLISTHSFARLHILHHPRRCPEPQKSFILSGWFPQFFICHGFSRRLVRFNFRLPHVKILQSCNGLLLLECRHSPFGTTLVYTILNPTTMQSRILIKREAPLLLGLFFDPCKSPYYRVVCFEKNYRHRDLANTLSVFDSQTNTWKEEGTSPIRPDKFTIHSVVYWNNSVYILGSHHWLISLSSDGNYRYIKRPRIGHRDGAEIRKYIMEANGHLHYLVLSLMAKDTYLVVYKMRHDGSGWLIKYTASFNPISVVRSFKCCLIGLVRGDKEEDSMVVFHMPGKIMVYRFLERTFKVLVNFKTEDYYEEGELQFGLTKPAFPFIETLAHV
ncbi:hypothetical protein C2S53_008272 [Perilla frutescens var. hirtella]|uniref:F-box domain-containing protein n=1 Tax=Perilla frutescens var. hirtella TaxID=608512 RepID=A0AAD4JEL9_PERFH|nr:hypothetical protein C2S53_008272 [Perilla frutescens var. hirtella]